MNLEDHPLGRAVLRLVRESLQGFSHRQQPVDFDGLKRDVNEFLTKEQQDKEEKFDYLQQRLDSLEMSSKEPLSQDEFNRQFYSNPLYAVRVEPPTKFGDVPKIKGAEDLARIEKLLPRGSGKFSGEKNGPMINEFLEKMNEQQSFLNLTEQEFQTRLLACLTAEPYDLAKQLLESGRSIHKIYYELQKNYDTKLGPAQASEKLKDFKIHRQMTSKTAETQIMKLALRAALAYPKGETRQMQCQLLCFKAYQEALPPRASEFVQHRYNDLAVQLGRAPEFTELSSVLDPHRVYLDGQISSHGANSPKKPFQSKPLDLSTHNCVPHTKTFQVKSARQSRPRPAAPQFDWSPVVRHLNVAQRAGPRPDARPAGRRPAGPAKPPKLTRGDMNRVAARRGCSLCGGSSHTASMGCFSMRDDNGKVVDGVTPTYGFCGICIEKQLNHPEKFCPDRFKRRQNKPREPKKT